MSPSPIPSPLLLSPDGRQTGARFASAYVLLGLVWICLTAALLLLAGVSGRAAIWGFASSALLWLVISRQLFLRWQAGMQRAVTELVGLSGAGSRGGDSQASARNQQDAAQQSDDGESPSSANAGNSNDRLQRVAAVVPGALFTYQRRPDGGGRYLFLSDAITEIYGQTSEELCSAPDVHQVLLPLLVPEDVPHLCETWGQAQLEPFNWHCEFRVRHPRRGEIWVECRAIAGNASATLWYGMLSDITSRKRAEAELRRSEELCRVLMEHQTDAVYLHEEDGRISLVNSAALASLGYSAAELVGQTPDLFDPHFRELAVQLDLPGALSRKEMVRFDSEHVRKDGRRIPVEVRLKGCDSGGRAFALSSVRDITERKKRELALQASERRFRQLADLIPGVVWCQTGDLSASYLSERWFEYTGLRDALRESLLQVVHPDDVEPLYERFADAQKAKKPYRCEYRLRHISGGDYRWFLACAVPAIGPEASIDEWFGLAIDIDDLKRTEAALREERDRFDRLASVAPGVLHTYRRSPEGKGSLVYASPNAASVLGLTPAELNDFAARPQQFMRTDDLQRLADAVQKSSQNLTPYRETCSFMHPKRGEVWIEVMSAPVREADGGTVWHGIICDVSERVGAALRLSESERRYRQLADAIPQALWTMSGDGVVDFLNWKAIEYSGFAGTALTDWSWKDQIHRQDRDLVLQCWEEAVRQLRLLEVAVRLRRADGVYRWHMVRLTPIGDGQGGIRNWCGISTDIDDMKQAEIALRADRDRFTSWVNTVPGVLFAFKLQPDGKTCFPFVSPQVAELYSVEIAGLAEDAAPILQRIHPDDLPEAGRTISASARDLSLWRTDYRIVHPTRGHIWVEGSAIPTRQADGSILWQGFLADITERKRAERELQQRVEMLRVLSTAATALLSSMEARPLAATLFDAAAQQLGCELYCQYRLGAGEPLQLVAPHSGDAARTTGGLDHLFAEQLCNRCAEVGGEVYAEGLQHSAESQGSSARALGLQMYVAHPLVVDGQLVGTLCFASRKKSALTESERSFASTFSQYVALAKARQSAEHALRDSEEKYRRLVQMLPVALLLSAEGRVSFCNAALARLIGVNSESELLGTVTTSLVHPDHQSLLQRRLDSHHSAPEQATELQLVRRNGTSVLVQIEVTRYQHNGRPANMIAVLDLTEREEQQAIRRKLEEQTWQAQKLEATGRLAGGVAHDFNNLLTIIKGCCHLVQLGANLSAAQQEALAGIDSASERAARLTKQLLALSRKALIEPRVVDLNALVRESLPLLQRLVGEGVVLSSKLDPLLRRVRVDVGQLDQVLLNLAVNSRDAMPRGGTLSLETGNIQIHRDDLVHYPDLRPGAYVRLSVSDNGMGIPADVLPNIFEPFFTTKPAGRGTGLGLAVVHGIIKQSGGHISVYSEVGLGTTFMLLFPAVPSPVGVANPPPLLADAPHGSETILLVDDEPELRRLARLSLTTHGYRVLEASNGEDALRIAEGHQGPIHLLLTDLVMPLMGGRMLAHTLRQRLPQVRVLFISGFTDDSVVRHGLLDASEAFLQKPFSASLLASAVRSLLDRKPS
ncbi:MAG TPA: PAS domain S-box protein [Pseudomonadota bacterium]|nr:PAS domain S-box protein [Pseudomonadota bacterium]